MPLKSRTAGVLAALAMALSAAQAQHFYIYNGTQVPLTVVADKVAVRAASTDAPQAMATAAAAASVSTTAARSLGVPGWSVVNVAGSQNQTIRAQATAAAVPTANASALSAVQTMAASPSVSYAAPVFTVAGSETVPSGEILVGLTPEPVRKFV